MFGIIPIKNLRLGTTFIMKPCHNMITIRVLGDRNIISINVYTPIGIFTAYWLTVFFTRKSGPSAHAKINFINETFYHLSLVGFGFLGYCDCGLCHFLFFGVRCL